MVIGVGGVLWLSFTILALFGYEWAKVDSTKIALLGAIPTVVVTYVVGIILDRTADIIFRPWSNKLRARTFGSLEEFQKARAAVYDKSALRPLFEYSRSRLRISRAWALNSVAIGVAFGAFVWSQLPPDRPRVKLTVFASVVLTVLTAGCVMVRKTPAAVGRTSGLVDAAGPSRPILHLSSQPDASRL